VDGLEGGDLEFPLCAFGQRLGFRSFPRGSCDFRKWPRECTLLQKVIYVNGHSSLKRGGEREQLPFGFAGECAPQFLKTTANPIQIRRV
jgi:hypothetical protein